MLRRGVVMAVQEVHATRAELHQALRRLHVSCQVFESIPRVDAGGVCIIVPCDPLVLQRARFRPE
eukprot:5114342-Pyramimonas_sp.AAC.1